MLNQEKVDVIMTNFRRAYGAARPGKLLLTFTGEVTCTAVVGTTNWARIPAFD